MSDKLIFPNVKHDKFYKGIGLVVMVSTLCLGFLFWYSRFFERELWLRRKAFIKWLENNELPEPKYILEYKTWSIDGYELTLVDGEDKWYILNGADIVIGSYRTGFLETRDYNKVLERLKL